MRTHFEVMGRTVTRRGHRLFAVAKPQTLTDRVAAASSVRGNWNRVMSEHSTATVIRNRR